MNDFRTNYGEIDKAAVDIAHQMDRSAEALIAIISEIEETRARLSGISFGVASLRLPLWVGALSLAYIGYQSF